MWSCSCTVMTITTKIPIPRTLVEVIIAKQRNGPIGTRESVMAAGVYQVCESGKVKLDLKFQR